MFKAEHRGRVVRLTMQRAPASRRFLRSATDCALHSQ